MKVNMLCNKHVVYYTIVFVVLTRERETARERERRER